MNRDIIGTSGSSGATGSVGLLVGLNIGLSRTGSGSGIGLLKCSMDEIPQ